MGTFIFRVFFFLVLCLTSNFLVLEAAFHGDCKPTKCNPGAPDIHFPFQIRAAQQPQHCGHPGFELNCVKNDTVIHFPSHGDLVVKSISYDTKKLDLLDPRNCVHQVFLNLNLSLTPFVYYYALKSYTYLNCSSNLLSYSFTEIPCLSSSKHHVYTVDPSMAVPSSCKAIKTVEIPFGYSSYLSDNSFGLGLTWGFLGGQDCESKGGKCALRSKAAGPRVEVLLWIGMMMMCVFGTATFMSLQIYWSRKTGCKKEGEYDQVGVVKTMGDYEALNMPEINADDVDVEQARNHH